MATQQERTAIREEAALEATDPAYTDQVLDDLYEDEGSVRAVVYRIWKRKAAATSTLVDTSESGSSRRNSQLHTNALKMMEQYAPIPQTQQAAELAKTTVPVARA